MRAHFTSRSRGAGVRRTCPGCGSEFVTFQSEIDRGRGRFCGRACYHAQQGSYAKPLAERFWAKVNKTDGCWLWTGSVDTHGYGQIKEAGVNRLAHRVAWELVNGPIPDGVKLLHNCPGGDNPRCVRPSHTFRGTQKENMRDAAKKGRTAQGERLRASKLTPAIVLEIRRRYAAGDETMAALSASFGVGPATVSQIVRRATWKHLPVG